MRKKSINLLIEATEETGIYKRLKKIMPLTAAALLILFIIFYAGSLFYIRSNNREYKLLQSEIKTSEKNISKYQSTEGIYLATYGILDVIKKILAKNTSVIADTLPEILHSNSEVFRIKTLTVDRQGQAVFNVTAFSLPVLEAFVDDLKTKENEALFSDIKAQGILREKDGSYTLNISLKYKKSTTLSG